MLNFDSALQTQLNSCTDKTSWCNTLITALGTNLKIRCRRVDDASSTAVFANGVEFYNATLSNTIIANTGALVNFGNVINATTQLAADLSTGASVLRIEGASHWMEGTLGLSNSSCDYKVPASPTTKTSMGFGPISITAPRALPTGTGPVAPTLDANAPAFMELIDWSNPAIPVSVKIIPLDTRKDDLVYQDAELAAQMGDVRVTQSSQTIVYGQFEFGITLLSVHGGLNLDAPGTPVHQVLIAHMPYNTWPSYPMSDTYRAARDLTFPKPYKLKIYNAQMVVIKTFEMHDGLAVNDLTLSQHWGLYAAANPKTNQPLRPHMHCGQLHFWQSAKLKYSTNASKYMAGTLSQDRRPSMAKTGYSSSAVIPLSSKSSTNSALHWYAAPEFPLPDTPYGTSGATTVDLGDTFDDPYLYDVRSYNSYNGLCARITGWNYEPGAIMCHDWYATSAGPRSDRITFNTALVRYVSDPNGTRLKGNVSNRVMLDAYNHGYFHHGHHYFTNVKHFSFLPKEWLKSNEASYMNTYYGAGPYALPTRSVDLACSQFSVVTQPRDGHDNPWNDWELDNLNTAIAPAIATVFCNSPAHTISGAQRLQAHFMSQLGLQNPTTDFLNRAHIWRILQLVVAWKAATTNPLGIDRELIEQCLQAELEGTYDQVYTRAILNNENSSFGIGIRTFGQPISIQYASVISPWKGTKYWSLSLDSRVGYLASVLILMRQTGCWAAMASRSTKCATTLRFLIDCGDKSILENMYWTKGRWDAIPCLSSRVTATSSDSSIDTAPNPTCITNWNQWATLFPATNLETLMTDVNGAAINTNIDTNNYLRFQWIYMRRDYFPEYTHSLLADTITMTDKWLNDFETKILALSTQTAQTTNDFAYLWPSHGRFNPPPSLTPLTK